MKSRKPKSDWYRVWVCGSCGEKARKAQKTSRLACSTWHEDVCGVCGEITDVTEPRDFGYPEFERKV